MRHINFNLAGINGSCQKQKQKGVSLNRPRRVSDINQTVVNQKDSGKHILSKPFDLYSVALSCTIK